MGVFINFFLTLCTLHLLISLGPIVTAARRPWTDAEASGAGMRRSRAVNSPIPVSCVMGKWSSWTPCNSCTEKRFRFRSLERPSQFGGDQCPDSQWANLVCPDATTPCLVPDYCGESFTCNETGRCIGQNLRCNGEADCEDFSDEEGCVSVNQRDDKCSTLLPIPGAELGTQGFNAFTGELVDRVLDPRYYGGECEYVYNGDWRRFNYDSICENLHYTAEEKNYRKPYNYHTYRFVAEARSEGSEEYYTDMSSLLEARGRMRSISGGLSVGFWFVTASVSGSRESEFLTNITKYNRQDLGFVRLTSRVQTAQFKMRSNRLMLHEDFYFSLMELPEQYDFGMYSRFFNTFGTHYITEGTMGGTLEHVIILNKTSLAESKLDAEQAGRCLGLAVGVAFSFDIYTVGLHAGKHSCKKSGSVNQDQHSNTLDIVDIVTLVKGGIVDSSAGLSKIRDPATYRSWGESLKYNPDLIEYEIMPIYELIRLSTAADHVGARLDNMQRAWEEYQQQFHPCRCKPCRHNGTPVLKGTSCQCDCKPAYTGDACEDNHGRATKTDGAWSCWGTWSICASGMKTRTRTCDNPAPVGEGAACLGSSSQTQRC